MSRQFCCAILGQVLVLSALPPAPGCSARIPLASASVPLSAASTSPVNSNAEALSSRFPVRSLLHKESDPPDDVVDDVSHGAEGFVGFVDGASRPDPLRGFHEYKGGFDVDSEHYWSSAAFTGIWGYAIGAVWLLVGVLLALCFLIRSCCRNSSKQNGRSERNGRTERNGGSGGLYVGKPVVTKARGFVLGMILAVAFAGGVLAVMGTVWVSNEVDQAAETARASAQDAVRVRDFLTNCDQKQGTLSCACPCQQLDLLKILF